MQCQQCDVPLTGKRTKWCSEKCRQRHWISENGRSKWASERICEMCKATFLAKDRRQRFCSHSCAAKHTNSQRGQPPKECEQCGGPLRTRKQTFCSVSCRRQSILVGWLNGERHSEWGQLPGLVRDYLYQTRGRQCEICGWCEVNPTSGKIPVEIDHIDGDSRNHGIENLRILCPNHHALTPTFRNLNPNGRKRRK